jgi:hypothetical protein
MAAASSHMKAQRGQSLGTQIMMSAGKEQAIQAGQ